MRQIFNAIGEADVRDLAIGLCLSFGWTREEIAALVDIGAPGIGMRERHGLHSEAIRRVRVLVEVARNGSPSKAEGALERFEAAKTLLIAEVGPVAGPIDMALRARRIRASASD